ncbi:unnamed protein product [Colias eurytheme]|nr:unnamed protein product [Colias eurytheme]
MEEVLKALNKIQKELDEQKVTIKESAQTVTEQVTQNINQLFQEKISILEEKHEKLNQLVENQEKRIYFMEKQSRQRNIVFFELIYSDIQDIKRIGKKGDRPRPTVVTFTTLGLKIKTFKQKKALEKTPYYMKEDYPKYVLEKRKELQEQLKSERAKGNLAILKYDKLVILKANNKRTLPISPEEEKNKNA